MSEKRAEPRQAEGTPEAGPGPQLKAARESRELTLEQVVEALGIARHLLAALEADDFASLGAPVYVRGYLRKYARYLGLPGDRLVARYEAIAAPHDPEVHAHATSALARPRAGRWLVPTTIAVAAIVLILVGFWAWQKVRMRTQSATPPAAAVSAAMAVTRAIPVAAQSGSRDAAAGSAPAGASAGRAAAGAVHLELDVTAPSWVEVYSAAGKRLYYDLASAGQKLRFAQPAGAFTVFLGNEEGVAVSVDGHPFAVPQGARTGKTARFKVGAGAPSPASSP